MICPKCKREHKRTYCEFCKREERWERIKNKTISFLPPLILHDLNHLKIDITEGLNFLNQKKGVFLRGSVGSGKSTYAAALLIEEMRLTFIEKSNYNTFDFVNIPELFQTIKETFSITGNSEGRIINHLASVDLLVLDDISAGRPTPWSLNVLYLIIEKRSKTMKQTIVTSTLSGNELSKKFNKISDTEEEIGIVSRINGTCKSIILQNKDFRIK